MVGGAFLFQQPARHLALSLLRWPFTLVHASARVALLLPRVPGLAQENAALRAELTERQLEAAQLREMLRAVLHAQELMAQPSDRPRIAAQVISRSTIPTQQTVLLSRGRRDGLSSGSIVVDADGVVGRVVDVQPGSSLTLLVTDPDSRIAGMVERTRESGLLIGRAQGQCQLIYLHADADVQAGDRVVTAGLGGPFPKGLLLGTVTEVARNVVEGTALARVTPAARLGRLEEVLCLLEAR